MKQKRRSNRFDIWSSLTEFCQYLYMGESWFVVCVFFFCFVDMLLWSWCAAKSCVHLVCLCVFVCACMLECEPCVNMLIQAVPVTHSCPAWLRSGKLIILAALMSVSPAVCVDREEKVPLPVICHPLHHPCQGTIHDKCVCYNELVSRQASLIFCPAIITAIWCFMQTEIRQAALSMASQMCGQYMMFF